MQKKTPQIKYVFAGAIRDEDNLMENLPDNCMFLGHLSKEHLPEFYTKSRYLVMASRWYEGLPMTILEAASYGKPTIGPAHAGFTEIIDNDVTGLLFTPSNVDDLEQKIIYLWNNPNDCISMGKKAFEKLKDNYTMNAVKMKWETLFNELI